MLKKVMLIVAACAISAIAFADVGELQMFELKAASAFEQCEPFDAGEAPELDFAVVSLQSISEERRQCTSPKNHLNEPVQLLTLDSSDVNSGHLIHEVGWQTYF